MADTRRALDDFVNPTTGIFRNAQNCNAQDMRDFIVSVYGTSGLFVGATKTASFTAAVGELYPISIASLAANIDVTFPSTPTAGDTFGYFVNTQNVTDTGSSGFATAPFWGVDPVNATVINNESYTNSAGDGTEKWGLFINSELLIFKYVDATVGWQVITPGKISHQSGLARTTAQTLLDATVDPIEHNSVTFDNAGMATTSSGSGASGTIDIKRAGFYSFVHRLVCQLDASGDVVQSRLNKNATLVDFVNVAVPGAGTYAAVVNYAVNCDAGDQITHDAFQNSSGTTPTLTDIYTRPSFTAVEII